jgi:glycosyltransferase involved in cell wall biosynthesis
MVHACRLPEYHIPQERDIIVNVSEASRSTWGEESERGIVIHNLPRVSDKNALVLVSATRIGGDDKGGNDARMRTLAQMLTTAGIPFLWLCFSEKPLLDMPFGFVNMDLTVDVQPFIKRADYVVQLSDAEAYSYSILEALTNNVPVICTPFESAAEQGVVDGETGYIVPFNMDFDVTMLMVKPSFRFRITTDEIAQWRSILGDTKPTGKYKPPKMVKARVLMNYHDLDLDRDLVTGAIEEMKVERIKMLVSRGLVESA